MRDLNGLHYYLLCAEYKLKLPSEEEFLSEFILFHSIHHFEGERRRGGELIGLDSITS